MQLHSDNPHQITTKFTYQYVYYSTKLQHHCLLNNINTTTGIVIKNMCNLRLDLILEYCACDQVVLVWLYISGCSYTS